MAESYVQVTEGSGKKLHAFERTIGANTIQDEVVVLGHPYEAAYYISPGAFASLATDNSHLLQIMAGSSKNVYVKRIVAYMHDAPAALTSVQFQLVRLTTAGTGGTAGGADPFDTSDSAAGFTSMTLPSSKGTEPGQVLANVIGVVPATFPSSGLPIVFDMDYRGADVKCPRIAAGTSNGLAVKTLDPVASCDLLIVAIIVESNF